MEVARDKEPSNLAEGVLFGVFDPKFSIAPIACTFGAKVDGGDVANGVWITGPSPRGGDPAV